MLKVRNLSKSIQNKKILNNLSFDAGFGGIHIFLGGSGVGKSTLLRVLNSLEGYDRGEFSLDGEEFELKKMSRNQTIGMVFQQFHLFENFNVEDNIVYSLIHAKKMQKKEAQSVASEMLERYGLKEHAKAAVGRLSGGQKQRLAIARTLSLNPGIVCLDEPTSALDPRLTNQVAKYITELAAEKRIVLLTTHDMGLLEQLDAQLFLLEQGSIVESVSKQDYVKNPERYPKLQTFFKGETAA